jgi:nuclear pore complex protein Nup54
MLDLFLSSLVPVLAVGFDDLQKRVDAQTNQATSQQAKLQVRQILITTFDGNLISCRN